MFTSIILDTKFGPMEANLTQGSHCYVHPKPDARGEKYVTVSGHEYQFSVHLYFRDGKWKVGSQDTLHVWWEATYWRPAGKYNERGPRSYLEKVLSAVVEAANQAITTEARQAAHDEWLQEETARANAQAKNLREQIRESEASLARLLAMDIDEKELYQGGNK